MNALTATPTLRVVLNKALSNPDAGCTAAGSRHIAYDVFFGG